MDYNKIKILIDRYFNGETSLEEEKVIRDFMLGDDIPLELSDEKELFDSFNTMKKDSKPLPGLKNELNDLIENKWKESSKERFQKIRKWSLSTAASIAICISIYFYYNQKPNDLKDTFTDQRQAYAATKQVLTYISEKMSSESAKLSSLTQINKSFNNMDKLKNVEKAIKNYKSAEK